MLQHRRVRCRLKLLMTQRKLVEYAGTEIVTMELALALAERGHEVAVYCPRPGKLNDILTTNGIVTVETIAEVPFQPDLVHAHHQLPTLAALARFAGVPFVYMCHGQRPWVEQPPVHPQIALYVAVSQKLARHIATTLGLEEETVRVVRNFVDTRRFSRVRPAADGPPRRAAVFGQNLPANEIATLERACRRRDISLETIGYAYGNPRLNPELFLPDYDLIFAIGRSALEAMACGCPTIPVVPRLAGALVTPETFDEWTDVNFSPRYFTSSDQVGDAWLDAQLERLDPAAVAEVTRRVRAEFSLEAAVDALEAIHREALTMPLGGDGDAAIVRALDRLAGEVDAIWEETRAGTTKGTASVTMVEAREMLALVDRQSEKLREAISMLHGADAAKGPLGEDWAAAVARSGLFDANWYLVDNPDVADAGIDPLQHYLEFGGREGRRPSPYFDGDAYLDANPRLKALADVSGLSPLEIAVREAVRPTTDGENHGAVGG